MHTGRSATKRQRTSWAVLDAARAGDVEVVRALHEPGNDVNRAETEYGRTPTRVAAEKGHVEVVRALHALGADVNRETVSGRTPTYVAAAKGHVEVIHALHALGADVNRTTLTGMTPFYVAAEERHAEVVRALHALGADVNRAMIDGETPTSVAAHEGHVEVIQALHALGVDLNQADADGEMTPTYIAARNGRVEVVRALHALGADVNRVSFSGETPCGVAAQQGHSSVTNLFAQISRQIAWEGHARLPGNLRHPTLRDSLQSFAADMKSNYESLVAFWVCCSGARRGEGTTLHALMRYATAKIRRTVAGYLIPLHESRSGWFDPGRTYLARSTMDRLMSWPDGAYLPGW